MSVLAHPFLVLVIAAFGLFMVTLFAGSLYARS